MFCDIKQFLRVFYTGLYICSVKAYPNWRKFADDGHKEILFESSSGHTLTCCLNLVKYRFKNMLRKESLTRSSTVI